MIIFGTIVISVSIEHTHNGYDAPHHLSYGKMNWIRWLFLPLELSMTFHFLWNEINMRWEMDSKRQTNFSWIMLPWISWQCCQQTKKINKLLMTSSCVLALPFFLASFFFVAFGEMDRKSMKNHVIHSNLLRFNSFICIVVFGVQSGFYAKVKSNLIALQLIKVFQKFNFSPSFKDSADRNLCVQNQNKLFALHFPLTGWRNDDMYTDSW